MSKSRVECIGTAVQDLLRIAHKNPQDARRVTEKILLRLELLEDYSFVEEKHPDVFLHRLGYRLFPCGDYTVTYRALEDRLLIYQIR